MKVDLKKELTSYQARRGHVDVIEVSPARYLAMDADGGPNGEAFEAAIGALYPLAYTIKFASKRELERDYVVPPLEALWWADDMAAFTTARNEDEWRSTLLLMVPGWVPGELIEAARGAAAVKIAPGLIDRIRADLIDEGLCAQTLHVGPFADEGPVVEQLHRAVEDAGLEMSGRHHEIYLSDMRRTAPEKLRTILRQPVSRRSTVTSESR